MMASIPAIIAEEDENDSNGIPRENSMMQSAQVVENNEQGKIPEAHHLSHGLPIGNYESLDYDECSNRPLADVYSTYTTEFRNWNGFISWVLMFVIGALTAMVAVMIDVIVDDLMDWKYAVVGNTITTNSENGELAYSLLLLLAFNVPMVLLATLMTCFEPLAAGSGIPEVKVYLNGVVIPGVTALKTLVVKATGVLFSVAGGLFVGREGPMIHSGAVVGAGIPQFQLNPFIRACLNPNCVKCEGYKHFRSDRQKRDFVSAGAAAGVAAAFGAPIGGVLFSLEEGSSFWNQSLTWKSLACAMTSTAVLNFWLSGINYGDWSSFDNPGLLNFGSFNVSDGETLWSVFDLIIFVAMGAGGGLLGAAFNSLNYNLTRYRILHVFPKGKWARALESLLVIAVTTTVAFTASMAFGRCGTISKADFPNENTTNGAADAAILRTYFCVNTTTDNDTLYNFNDMATLFFNGQETSIKALFHNPGAFSLSTLFGFFICFYLLMCWTYGILVPSGLFVPSLLCGAAYGRIWAHILTVDTSIASHLYPGSFALIGSAAFLGGVVRMTISLTVILIETTNEITYGLPIMLTLLTAKFVGDIFNIGLYDIHNEMKGIPFLEFDAPEGMDDLNSRDIMRVQLTTLMPHSEIRRIIEVLKTTRHNAFPVVTPEVQQQENFVTESQTTQQNGVALRNIRFRKNSLLKSVKHASADYLSISHKRGSIISQNSLLQTDVSAPLTEAELYATQSSPLGARTMSQAARFHGIILRSQLIALLKHKVGYRDYQGDIYGPETQKKLTHWQMIEDYPHYPKIEDIDLDNIDPRCLMDLSEYMNNCPYTVSPHLPAPKVFNIFRTMGLRHLPVVNSVGQLVGLITRHDLTHEAMHHCLVEKLLQTSLERGAASPDNIMINN